MSKIIDALEKAKQDGHLEQTAGALAERDTLAPVAAPTRKRKAVRKKRRDGPQLLTTRTLAPEVLAGVDPHLETLHKPMSVVSEQYRALRNRIERMNFEGRLHTMAVTSAIKGEGKSVTAANLAVVLAQDVTKDVLLVDADLRRPKIHKLLHLDLSPGLGECLRDENRLREPGWIRETPYFGLDVVTAGEVHGHPAELLASPQLSEMLDQWRSRYDYVVFDTPPLHPISDVNFLTDMVDGVLLVVRANKTSKSLLKQAVTSVPSQKLIGTVLNRSETLSRGYGYKGGYGYYYKYY
ncbi:MAG: XrtA-associated tyrosine autokinase [Deferrisomatales bacterium]